MEREQGQERTGQPGWTAEQMQHFEKRLHEERRRAVAQMGDFNDTLGANQEDATGELSSWRFHMADLGSETFEREQNFLLASREGQLLYHINEGLRRLYTAPETYGRCEECGMMIGYERMDALPYATRCIHCKQDWEGGRAD